MPAASTARKVVFVSRSSRWRLNSGSDDLANEGRTGSRSSGRMNKMMSTAALAAAGVDVEAAACREAVETAVEAVAAHL